MKVLWYFKSGVSNWYAFEMVNGQLKPLFDGQPHIDWETDTDVCQWAAGEGYTHTLQLSRHSTEPIVRL
jgi:hypothetical protein